MSWVQWIMVIVLIGCGIYFLYPTQKAHSRRDHTPIVFPVTKKSDLVYTPASLPYTIHEFHELLSVQECKEIQSYLVVNERVDQTAYAVIPSIQEIATRLTHQPPSHMEPLEIVRYTKGGSNIEYDARENEVGQTRIATIVFFLNEAYVGGELVFANEKIIVPHQGKAVLYWNSASGMVLEESLHRNKFVLRGVQWKAIQYVHNCPV